MFPCQPGQKIPATPHGYRDATTDPEQITDWFARHPDCNLAIATGAPGPDVLDVDVSTARPGTGTPRSAGSATPGCWTARPPTSAPPAAACTSTSPAPPSATATCPRTTWTSAPRAATSWPRPPRSTASPTGLVGNPAAAAAPELGHASPALLQPQPQQHRPDPGRPGTRPDLGHLARWVAAQPEGNRNAGLFWAANRALETDPAADLSPLADAARQAGLADPEITRTLDSARRTGQARPEPPATRPKPVTDR